MNDQTQSQSDSSIDHVVIAQASREVSGKSPGAEVVFLQMTAPKSAQTSNVLHALSTSITRVTFHLKQGVN